MTWCGLFLNARLISSVELVSPGLCHPDKAAHPCPQKTRVFLSVKMLLELLHTREFLQAVLVTISPASQSLLCLDLRVPWALGKSWATNGPPQAKKGKQGNSPMGIIRLQATAFGRRGSGHNPQPLVSFSHAVMFGHHLCLPHSSGFVLSCQFDCFNFSVPRSMPCPGGKPVPCAAPGSDSAGWIHL